VAERVARPLLAESSHLPPTRSHWTIRNDRLRSEHDRLKAPQLVDAVDIHS